jgi:hypothetical protein
MPENPSVEEPAEDKCLDFDEIRKNLESKLAVVVECFDQEKLSKREAVLLVFIFIFAAIAVSVGLIVGDIMKERDDCEDFLKNASRRLNVAEEDSYVREICLTDTCVRQASQVMYDIDTKVSPCRDFYRYACGGWMKSNPVPPDQQVWGIKEKVEHEIRNQIRRSLEKPMDKVVANSLDSAIRKITVLYQSCSNVAAIDKAGTDLIREAINKIGGWALQGKHHTYQPIIR